MASVCFVLFLLVSSSCGQICQIFENLNSVADFALEHYTEINFDGLLGFVIAEGK